MKYSRKAQTPPSGHIGRLNYTQARSTEHRKLFESKTNTYPDPGPFRNQNMITDNLFRRQLSLVQQPFSLA
uniref:Uncharacterized protein n=1 Tax=Anguilla anguilla TaxID=7936 RepID=A0A0E9XCY7_ANGAN